MPYNEVMARDRKVHDADKSHGPRARAEDDFACAEGSASALPRDAADRFDATSQKLARIQQMNAEYSVSEGKSPEAHRELLESQIALLEDEPPNSPLQNLAMGLRMVARTLGLEPGRTSPDQAQAERWWAARMGAVAPWLQYCRENPSMSPEQLHAMYFNFARGAVAPQEIARSLMKLRPKPRNPQVYLQRLTNSEQRKRLRVLLDDYRAVLTEGDAALFDLLTSTTMPRGRKRKALSRLFHARRRRIDEAMRSEATPLPDVDVLLRVANGAVVSVMDFAETPIGSDLILGEVLPHELSQRSFKNSDQIRVELLAFDPRLLRALSAVADLVQHSASLLNVILNVCVQAPPPNKLVNAELLAALSPPPPPERRILWGGHSPTVGTSIPNIRLALSNADPGAPIPPPSDFSNSAAHSYAVSDALRHSLTVLFFRALTLIGVIESSDHLRLAGALAQVLPAGTRFLIHGASAYCSLDPKRLAPLLAYGELCPLVVPWYPVEESPTRVEP